MLKKTASVFLLVLCSFSVLCADKSYVIDTPRAGILSSGSYSTEFSCFSYGNIISSVDFGIFDVADFGLSWELDEFVGSEAVKIALPSVHLKIRLYGGDMTYPQLTMGYNGQGAFVDEKCKSSYKQKCRGLYFVAGRELLIEGLMLNLGININDFSNLKIYGFLNITVPLYKDILSFMVEYDNFSSFADARLNCGLRFLLTECLCVDFILKDLQGEGGNDGKNEERVPNERLLKISYLSKF
ncbi:MAG: hypothetical protein LBL71_03615 [Endomicrobium sp.]|jgi:hypothetical protein|nr:hypothetical protein [Endomicrobium sp.]